MKTAMKEAIKEIAELWGSPSDSPNYTQIFKVLESKLEKEKEQIVQSYQIGGINNYDSKLFPNLTPEYFKICGEEYFEKHYK